MTSYRNSSENQSAPWRSVLCIHPAAELLPRMSDADLKELGADIAANGQLVPVVLLLSDDGTEQLLDGISRLDAMERAGIAVVKDGAFNHDRVLHQHIRANTDPYLFVCSVNVHRRHLTNEQKTEFIGKVIALRPTLSDRQIAGMTGTSHPTVAKVRAEMEAGGKITTSGTRTDKRGREQPATKPPKPDTTPTAPDSVEQHAGGEDHADLAGPHQGADHHDGVGQHHGDDDAAPTAPPAPAPLDPPCTQGTAILADGKAVPSVPEENTLHCSFCGKSQHEVHKLIAKSLIAKSPVFICNECVELCVDTIREKNVTGLDEKNVTGTEVAAAFNKLSRKECAEFFAAVLPAKNCVLRQHFENTDAEIAKLAREASALLTHAEHNKNDIYKRLARIVTLTDADKLKIEPNGKSNAKLDPALFSAAVGLDAGTKH